MDRWRGTGVVTAVAVVLVAALLWASPALQLLDGRGTDFPTPVLDHGFYACLVETLTRHPGLVPGSGSGFELEYLDLRTYRVTTWHGTRTIRPADGGRLQYRGWMEPVHFSLDCPSVEYP